MNASISLKLFEITKEFIKDNDKAKEFVAKIEETIDQKFDEKTEVLATKRDIAEVNKNIYIIGLVQFLAIVGSVLAIVSFMIK